VDNAHSRLNTHTTTSHSTNQKAETRVDCAICLGNDGLHSKKWGALNRCMHRLGVAFPWILDWVLYEMCVDVPFVSDAFCVMSLIVCDVSERARERESERARGGEQREKQRACSV